MQYMETSAKDNTNVEEVFYALTDAIDKERPVGYQGNPSRPYRMEARAAKASGFCEILWWKPSTKLWPSSTVASQWYKLLSS